MFSAAVKHQNVWKNVDVKVIAKQEIFVEKVTAQTLVKQRRIVHLRNIRLEFVETNNVITLKLDVIKHRTVLKVETGLLLG